MFSAPRTLTTCGDTPVLSCVEFGLIRSEQVEAFEALYFFVKGLFFFFGMVRRQMTR